MTDRKNALRTKWDVIQEAMNNYDPKQELAKLEREKPSLDSKIMEAQQPR